MFYSLRFDRSYVDTSGDVEAGDMVVGVGGDL